MSAPDLGEAERASVLAVLRGTWLSGGPVTKRFEDAIALVAQRAFGMAVSSGTTGLHVAVRALGVTRGDLVLTTSFSFVASVNCFLYEGAVPVFADIDERTYDVDPASAEDAAKAAKGRIAALLPVHVFGQPCDMDALSRVAQANGAHVIEDACEAVGASYNGRPAGSFGDISVFAFYPNKQMTTGEGGMMLTDDPTLAAVCRSLRNQGRPDDDSWLRHVRLGYNYRLDELSAALGLAQADRLTELLDRRAQVAETYNRALRSIEGVVTPFVAPSTTRMSWFVYVIRLHEGLDRDRVAELLAREGVPTRPYFRPIHQQPYFVERFGDRSGSLPVTERVGRQTLALPFHSRLSEESVAFVAEKLRAVIEDAG